VENDAPTAPAASAALNAPTPPTYLAIYRSVGSEVGTETLALELEARGYKIAYPYVKGDGLMDFVAGQPASGAPELLALPKSEPPATKQALSEPLSQLQPTDAQPQPQPKASDFIDPTQIVVLVVPLVAFDPQCNRLGMGGGYYDRYIARLAPQTPSYGLAFDQQLVENLPLGPHDVALSAIITPSAIYRAKQATGTSQEVERHRDD
jgi:5-formyltetrahydrofolate cyclo-ligase